MKVFRTQPRTSSREVEIRSCSHEDCSLSPLCLDFRRMGYRQCLSPRSNEDRRPPYLKLHTTSCDPLVPSVAYLVLGYIIQMRTISIPQMIYPGGERVRSHFSDSLHSGFDGASFQKLYRMRWNVEMALKFQTSRDTMLSSRVGFCRVVAFGSSKPCVW